jgi:hypothetical protein
MRDNKKDERAVWVIEERCHADCDWYVEQVGYREELFAGTTFHENKRLVKYVPMVEESVQS